MTAELAYSLSFLQKPHSAVFSLLPILGFLIEKRESKENSRVIKCGFTGL